jgi:hypothetical protein
MKNPEVVGGSHVDLAGKSNRYAPQVRPFSKLAKFRKAFGT